MATIDDVMDKLDDLEEKIDALETVIESVGTQIENLELINYSVCTMCQGSGEVIPSHNTGGDPPEAITCPSCNGAGRVALGSSDEKD